MTLKLKTPPMPEPDGPWHWMNIRTGKSGLYEEDPRQFGIDLKHPDYEWERLPSPAQLAARDAQWLELVGPVVEAGRRALALMKEERECIFECHVDPATQQVPQGDHIAMDALNDYDAAIEKMSAALRAITKEQE